MIHPSKLALISPREHVTAILSDDRLSTQIFDCSGKNLGSLTPKAYVSRFPDTSLIEITNQNDAITHLKAQTTQSMCLDMTLMLFDSEISFETRTEIAQELNKLFESEQYSDYVLDIILSKPLSNSADRQGAIHAAGALNIISTIIQTINESQDNLRIVFNAWLSLSQTDRVSQIGLIEVYAAFSYNQIFRRLAIELNDKNSLNALTIDFASILKKQFGPDGSFLIVDFMKILNEKIPNSNKHKVQTKRNLTNKPQTNTSAYSQHHEDPLHTTPYSALKAAVSQVEKIGALFAKGKDDQADKILGQLISENLKHPNGQTFAVKSLCNVANQARISGRDDVSWKCLLDALNYPDGLDSTLYFQIGESLRRHSDYDKALTCFQKAQALCSTYDKGIHLAAIRVLRSQGHYDKALFEYLQIPTLNVEPHALKGLGDLYRKMGRPNNARKVYEKCLKISSDLHSAHAGLAEVWKQKGNLNRAIQEYNKLFERFPALDPGAYKIYKLSLSYLFRVVGQYDRAEKILRELENTAPYDSNIKFQFARLYYSKADLQKAEEYFQKSRSVSDREFVDELRQSIFARLFEVNTQREATLTNLPKEIMPEDSGLACCYEAFSQITRNNFADASNLLNKAIPVDRLISDFTKVLQFHSDFKREKVANYKYSQRLCRIVKKGSGGDYDLRNAIKSIANNDFEQALKSEKLFLIRAA
tara:strand:+ start:52004 stop:54112 length:2109 start_codon:yes stop_codon:yes gene_type:complete